MGEMNFRYKCIGKESTATAAREIASTVFFTKSVMARYFTLIGYDHGKPHQGRLHVTFYVLHFTYCCFLPCGYDDKVTGFDSILLHKKAECLPDHSFRTVTLNSASDFL